MWEQLQQIAQSISNLLENDDFPDRIRPSYLRSAVRDYPVRGGKRLRPALLTWCSGLFIHDQSELALKTIYPAAATEVFHNWTLVHDDIIDRDDTRRGVPTCHVKLATELANKFSLQDDSDRMGQDFAILTGDLQQAWANHLLLRATEHQVQAKVIIAIAKRLQELAGRDLISGEALDVEFSLRDFSSINASEVRNMLLLKTGALLQFCAEAGAMIGLDCADYDNPAVSELGKFALASGIAFQLRDDYLGIFGASDVFGKGLGSDLREAKATPILLNTLQMSSESGRKRLLGYIGRESYSPQDLEVVRQIIRASGATDACEHETTREVEKAHDILNSYPDCPCRGYLAELVDFMVNREY